MFNWLQANLVAFTIVAVIVVVLLTVVIFSRRRNFGYGRVKGKPANPTEVRRQNPPDPSDR
jgi:hypothetical protein